MEKRFEFEMNCEGVVRDDDTSRSRRSPQPAASTGFRPTPGQRSEYRQDETVELSGYGVPKLSSRQQQILVCIIHGYQNKAIADLLGIEIVTVKMHIGILFKKLGVTNRTKAAVRGMGLITSTAEAEPDWLAVREEA
ncbi:helix-turn-helix domain-containing protein [Burkholderia plantarii]|uniref:helix-turn-helix domain-containing protein n=1 Tax=Burkholderia plantarii TaxID=41899 RepID=UPI001F5B595E|nr:helix-turn-helix transcriptional regulator [Burkholderia plantarii]